MPLSIGIIGLPNVGKSTLFQTITRKQVDIKNYPFCTIDPNIGVVAVPDKRVDDLARLAESEKKIYTTIELLDIAGLVKGANKGEGLGNKFLANIREVDAIICLLRAFLKEDIINLQQKIDVLEEKEILDTELILKDLETVEKRVNDLEGEAKSGKKEEAKWLEIFKKAKQFLEEGKILAEQDFKEEESKAINQAQLLTMKPRLYLLNGKEEEVSDSLKNEFEKRNWSYLIMDVLAEFEAAELSKEERKSFGLPEDSKLDILIKKCYQILGLITFFTTGPDETRAWTLREGEKAPRAGGVIHSDFESHFIKAEVINSKDLLEAGGFIKAKEKGLIRTEGKDYQVKDGDVVEIKHNA